MSNQMKKKHILIGIIAIFCVGVLLAGIWLPTILNESGSKKSRESPQDVTEQPGGQPLTIYEEPVIEPGTNKINGLTNEDWFSETLDTDELDFITDQVGTTEFNSTETTQSNNWDDRTFGDGEEEAGAADLDTAAPKSDQQPREIEEADIIKLDGDTLYILNTYRGLIIVDVSTPDEPEIEARVPLFGYPVEMYIVKPKAYIVLTHYYNAFLWAEGSDVAPEYRQGSEIVIIDISDHSEPKVEQYIELEGFITDTRRVGEVIYAVANNYEYFGNEILFDTRADEAEPEPVEAKKESSEATSTSSGDDDEDTDAPDEYFEPQEGTVVVSINFENLDNITEMDRAWFPGSSNEIHVTEDAIFIAQPEYNYDRDEDFGGWNEYYTKVTYVDISDYHGDIKIRDTFTLDGNLEDRYQMDYYDDMFRIVTHFRGEWDKLGESKLWIYDTSNPEKISKLGDLMIDDAGTLMATRFAGERAYTIHLPRRVDPLDVLDLSDPTDPKLCDVFEMPGWVTHMEVRGLKILALGVDDSEGKNKVAVSLFDVTDPYNVTMEERVIIGEGYSWSTANWDPKALSVIDDQNLILVPFDSYSYDKDGNYEAFSGLQIVEFDLEKGDLTAGGAIEQMGTVQRTRANSERIFAISYQHLQVINAKQRDKPTVTATLELCNNIVDVIPMGDYCVQIISDYNYYQGMSVTKLRTVPADEPDTPTYLAEKTVEYNIMKTYTNDNYIYLVCSEYLSEEYKTQGRILVFDYTDPEAPTLRSNFVMDHYNEGYYYGGYYGGYYYDMYYNPREALTDYSLNQVDGDIIVYHPSPWTNNYGYYYEDDIDYADSETTETDREEESEKDILPPEEGNKTEEPEEKPDEKTDEKTLTEILYIIDLSNPDAPEDLGNITLKNTTQINGLYSRDETLYILQYEDLSGYDENRRWQYKVKNYITAIDLSTPAEPELGATINIPGVFLGLNDDGTVLYTRSSEYDEEYNWHQTLNVLELKEDKAVLATALDLGQTYADIVIEDSTILLTYNNYDWYYYGDMIYEGDAAVGIKSSDIETKEPTIKTKIQVIDATDPENLKLKTTIGLKNYGGVSKLENNKLYIKLSDANGLLIYELTALASPDFLGYYPTQGWINSIRENTNTGDIYLACGLYGVLMVEVSE